MKLTLPLSGIVGAIVLTIALILFVMASGSQQAHANAGELPATIASSSEQTISTTPLLGFATSSACTTRIISTTASPIMITFSQVQGLLPAAQVGVLQPASTTVAYSNASYGCGAVYVYSFVSGPVYLTDSR